MAQDYINQNQTFENVIQPIHSIDSKIHL
ncbi:hypothetical protein F383_16841 [Gossypium arboreum]|uniref:Uncharacterized protein n=1 Tax=Gossypium arboreum TaxID=29729 RepID=A0A0B0NTM3_GOSAR|nr:hypothetical protein F383_16841 [Gossypium arboreum]